jgi:hypothetical protein
MKTVFETNIDFPIKVEQNAAGLFRVTYGKQVSPFMGYTKAAEELGLCLFHALGCVGQIDTRK